MATAEQRCWVYTADDMPNDKYHSHTEFISKSMLYTFAKSRREFQATYVTREKPFARKSHLDIGSVAHALILEPHETDSICTVIPKDALAKDGSKKGRAWLDFEAEHAGVILLKQSEMDRVRRIFDAVYSNKKCRELLELPGETEQSVFWVGDELPGQRCRFDRVCPQHGLVIDVKTSRNPSERSFRKDVTDFYYDYQQVIYSAGFEAHYGRRPDYFAFIAVTSEGPPFFACPYDLDADAVFQAEMEVAEHMHALRQCMLTNDWREPNEETVITLKPRRRYTGGFA